MIFTIGLLFTVATTTGVIAGNVREPRPRWTWDHPPSATSDMPGACAAWIALREKGMALGPCAPGFPGADVTIVPLEEAVYPDNLGRTVTTVARIERVAVSARVELVTIDALEHEVVCHVLGHGHAGRRVR